MGVIIVDIIINVIVDIEFRVELYSRYKGRCYYSRRYGRYRAPCRASVDLYAESW